jgi:hypothetical protein
MVHWSITMRRSSLRPLQTISLAETEDSASLVITSLWWEQIRKLLIVTNRSKIYARTAWFLMLRKFTATTYNSRNYSLGFSTWATSLRTLSIKCIPMLSSWIREDHLKASLMSIVRHIFALKLLESFSEDKTASLLVKKKQSRMHCWLSLSGSMHLIESSKCFLH